ncbi:MAG: T9SS type A sorting domain-containing protein [Bacteroidota bacterium]
MKTHKTILFLSTLVISIGLAAQPIRFQRTYGSTTNDWGLARPVSDGGYIMLMDDVTNPSLRDIALMKLDSVGNIVWKKTYANTSATDDSWNYAIEAYNGGYLVSGVLNVNTGTPISVWIRTDSYGDTLWVKKGLGGHNLTKTVDGGYAEVSFNLMKTDSFGNIQWFKTYTGASGPSYGGYCADKGYIILGETVQFSSGGSGDQDFYIIKADSNGNVQWTKVLGGPTSIEYAADIVQATDGGYLALGYSNGYGAGSWDIIAIKLDPSGNVQWIKTYGGANGDWAVDVSVTGAIGYIITGYTSGFESLQNSFRSFLLRIDGSGNPLWSKMYGDIQNNPMNSSDEAAYIYNASDGGFLMSGATQNFGAGGYDTWLIKTDPLGVSGCNEANTNPTVTNPVLVIGTGGTSIAVPAASSPVTVAIGSWQPQTSILCLSGPPPVGVEDNNRTDIAIYPNPFSSTFTIKAKTGAELALYDMLGKEQGRWKLDVGENTIRPDKLEAGLYFYRVVSENGTISSGKLIAE